MRARTLSEEYFELLRRCPLRPLRSEKDLDRAIVMIDELIGMRKRSRDADDYLDVLSDLVEHYETERHPIPSAAPVEMLEFFMEDRKLSQRALAQGSGIPVSKMSEILSGNRQMNLNHMQKVAAFLKVPVAVFVPDRKAGR